MPLAYRPDRGILAYPPGRGRNIITLGSIGSKGEFMMTARYSTSLALVGALGLAACGGNVGVNSSVAGNTPPPGSPPAPTVSLSAAPNPVASGGSTQLSWSSSNASGCNATGAWSGAKSTSGIQTTGSITTASTYTLTCTGSGGSTTRSTTVNVTGGGGTGASGMVDSSLLDRHQESANLAYAFAGFNTTAGLPVATAPVIQDVGACTFRYSIAGLANGNYTIALTSDGGTSFKRSANVTIAGAAATQDFAPARVLRVGPTRQFANPNDVTGIVSGDVIEIDAGVYNGPATIWGTDNLTLRGVGGRAHIVAPANISNGKATWVTQGNNMMVENIEFSGAAVSGLNGAGIRGEGQDLAICGSYFHDNQEGILGGGGNVLIEYTEFARNGNCIDVNGCAHNIYIDNTNRFTLRYSYSHHASSGHLVKSRAAENYILYNRIMDEADGNSSYQIDLPNGGLSYIVGNLLQQGPLNENPILVTYGEEGLLRPNHTLYVVNNTFVNDASGGTFVFVQGGSTATVQNNLLVGPGTAVSGTATQTSNLKINTAAANFVDIGIFDYRPTAATPGIDQGTAPGLGGAFDLTPIYQYVHPTNREPRPVRNAIDIGAYEYNP
jgi:hypothetical protein